MGFMHLLDKFNVSRQGQREIVKYLNKEIMPMRLDGTFYSIVM